MDLTLTRGKALVWGVPNLLVTLMNSYIAVNRRSLCAGVILALAAFSVNAQQDDSTQAYKKAGDEMMNSMMAPPYTGDADKDFVAHMIPHHEGAVEMAKIELKYGKDPQMKRLAKSIIQAQDKELREMRAWQSRHGAK
jgi:uncharacterized protein (DUF305 family)